MQLKRACIKNFTLLRDIEVGFGAHAAFIGGNGAGTATVLVTLESRCRVDSSQQSEVQNKQLSLEG